MTQAPEAAVASRFDHGDSNFGKFYLYLRATVSKSEQLRIRKAGRLSRGFGFFGRARIRTRTNITDSVSRKL